MGPPICDELMAFVEHTFTEEEAEVARWLRPLRGRTIVDLAHRSHKSLDETERILEQLAIGKRAIGWDGAAERRRYRVIPIMPGIFEMVLIGESPETMSAWHRRFAQLLEALFETGYTLDYQE